MQLGDKDSTGLARRLGFGHHRSSSSVLLAATVLTVIVVLWREYTDKLCPMLMHRHIELFTGST